MNNNIMQIHELIKTIEKRGFIECSNIENDNKEEYESILFYLNFCKAWFIGQIAEKNNRG